MHKLDTLNAANHHLDRYVAREVLAPFGMGVALLTFALVTGKLLKLTDMVVNHGVVDRRGASV